MQKGTRVSNPVTNRRALDVYFLREVAWSIHLQFLDPVDRAKTIPLSRITKIVNETWEGSDVVIPQDYVYRALLELQAMDKLRFRWKSDDIILTYNRPFLEVESDTWYRTFDGLFGLYSNPPSLYYLDKQLKSIADNPRQVTLDRMGRKYHGSTNTALKILRGLRMMRVLNFTDDGAYLHITDIQRNRCNKAVYSETFYACSLC